MVILVIWSKYVDFYFIGLGSPYIPFVTKLPYQSRDFLLLVLFYFRFRTIQEGQFAGFPCSKKKWNNTIKAYAYHYEHPYYEKALGMHKGETYMRRIHFYGQNTGNDSRFFRFSYKGMDSDETIYLDSPYFNITGNYFCYTSISISD